MQMNKTQSYGNSKYDIYTKKKKKKKGGKSIKKEKEKKEKKKRIKKKEKRKEKGFKQITIIAKNKSITT